MYKILAQNKRINIIIDENETQFKPLIQVWGNFKYDPNNNLKPVGFKGKSLNEKYHEEARDLYSQAKTIWEKSNHNIKQPELLEPASMLEKLIAESVAKIAVSDVIRAAKPAIDVTSEKRLTAYELGQEWSALLSLVNELTDPETGVTRELTEAEKAYLAEQTDKIGTDIKVKMDGICKVYKNIRMEAEIADAERKTLKDEMDRLSRRAQARNNEADRVKGLIAYLMDKVGMKKVKTELFTAGWQPTQKCVSEVTGFFNADKIPVEFLTREINKSAVKKAVEEGRLYEKDEETDPLARGKLFYMDGGEEKTLSGVSYLGGSALVIR
jgi:hypothetical protein